MLSRTRQKDRHHRIRHVHHPPPLPVAVQDLPRARSNPNIKLKRTWPPSPAVEEDIEDNDLGEVQSRGTVDQFPIILDANDPWEDIEAQLNNLDLNRVDCHSRTTCDAAPDIAQHTTKMRRKPKPAPIISGGHNAPIFDRRKTRNNGCEFLTSRSENGTAPSSGSEISIDALHGDGKSRDGDSGSKPRREGRRGVDEDMETRSNLSGSRTLRRYSDASTSLQDQDVRTAARDIPKQKEPHSVLSDDPRSEVPEKARRVSNSLSSRPRLEESQKNTLPVRQSYDTPLTASPTGTAISSATSGDYLRFKATRTGSQSQGLPPFTRSYMLPSPPCSPYAEPVYCRENSPRSGRSTAPSSRTTSQPPSPGIANTQPRYDESFRRTSKDLPVAEVHAHARPRNTSMASKPYNDFIAPHIHALAAVAASSVVKSLPYPTTAMPTMPSEDDHRFKPQSLGTVSKLPSSHPSVNAPSTSFYPPYPQQVATRPRIESRHTFTGHYPGMDSVVVPQLFRSVSTPTDSNDPYRHSQNPCPRPRPVRGYCDWHTLDGCPNFDICPSCLESVLRHRLFNGYFKRGSVNDSNLAIGCDFGTPWVLLAWQLTLERGRNDLDLIYNMIKIDAEEAPCPRSRSDTRSWYTIKDKRGHPLRDFEICRCDVKKVEVLLPALRGHFVRSGTTGSKRRCDLRSDSNRFTEYLDLLIDSHNQAVSKNKPADLTRFISEAEAKSRIPECERDRPLTNEIWHFPQDMPEFTVCEDCYDSVIEPAACDGSSVARRFNDEPYMLPHEASKSNRRGSSNTGGPGASCQLYSPRMRAIFNDAVKSGDFRYLAQAVQQRTQKEGDLRRRRQRLLLLEEEEERMSVAQGYRGDWQNHPRYGGWRLEFDRMREEWKAWE